MTTQTMSPPAATKLVCGCAICHKDIFEDTPMGDHFVYKCGELSYIELAHADCAKTDNETYRSMGRIEPYWGLD